MAVPILYSITPTTGHTGGQTLIEISGSDFAMPPAAPPQGVTSAPAPSMRVLLGGEPCPSVWVISPGLARALTPRHDPSGLPARDALPEQALPARPAIAASDVVVQNLDGNGAPIIGETATLAQAFSFVRPDLSQPGSLTLAMQAFLAEVARQVCERVDFNPHTDFDGDTGDAFNIAQFAALPGIAILDVKATDSADQTQEQAEDANEQTIAPEHGETIVRRSATNKDLVFTVLGASDSTLELLSLLETYVLFCQKNWQIFVGSTPFQLELSNDVEITGRIESSNCAVFTVTTSIRRIPISAIPGLPHATIAGVQTSGPTENILAVVRTFAELETQARRR